MRLADQNALGSLVANLAGVLASATAAECTSVPPRLAILDDGFDLDFFDDGVAFASAHLIQAMALAQGLAEIGEVNNSACSTAVRRKGYRTLRLFARGDALDHAESDGGIVDWIDADGYARSEWLLATHEPNRPPPRVRWREGFDPPAQLFLVDGTPWRSATDAMAARVMAARAAGIDFVDPVANAATGGLVTKPAG